MRLTILSFAAALSLYIGQAQARPFENFFDYREPRPPVAGDCGEISAAIGSASTWHGELSGKHYDTFNDQYYPFALQGCFDSELACRVWQQQAITYAGRGPLGYTSCRRGRG